MDYYPRKIEKSVFGRRIAVGDIHGCYSTFHELIINKLDLLKEDQLFLLGDLINRGNDSAKVLELVSQLQQEGYQIFPIRGNHEEKFLNAYSCGINFFENYLEYYNSSDLLNNVERHLAFINTFEYCIELDNFILSHAGINKLNSTPFTDLRGMFPKVNFKFDLKSYLLKTQVHGHLVRTIEEINNSVRNNISRFSIDSGCYLKEESYSYLTALDLDSKILFHQKNEI